MEQELESRLFDYKSSTLYSMSCPEEKVPQPNWYQKGGLDERQYSLLVRDQLWNHTTGVQSFLPFTYLCHLSSSGK